MAYGDFYGTDVKREAAALKASLAERDARLFQKQVEELTCEPANKVRQFDTGATRDTDQGKYDYEAFLSPLVIERYGAYMHQNRQLADGSLRDGDNWQKGIPKTAYMKSLWRHFFDVWKLHRGHRVPGVLLQEALCAVLFNTMGYLHEELKAPAGGAGLLRRREELEQNAA